MTPLVGMSVRSTSHASPMPITIATTLLPSANSRLFQTRAYVLESP